MRHMFEVKDVLNNFKYRKDFRRTCPWTTVVSMTDEIPDLGFRFMKESNVKFAQTVKKSSESKDKSRNQ